MAKYKNIEELNRMIEEGYITKRKHPEFDLWIYNYTPSCMYGKVWNESTLACRGLILDGDYNIIARPFSKFFNYEELTEDQLNSLKGLKYKTTLKLDGSLGILYWADNKPFIATRGSFVSEQAVKATEILYEKYCNIFNLLDKSKTYLFEIIYKENKIVVDYGEKEDLVLLAIIDNETGKEEDIHMTVCKIHINMAGYKSFFMPVNALLYDKYYKEDLTKQFKCLKNHNNKNEEGYVIAFENGYRVKVKFEDYINLHRIVTNFTNVSVWEALSENKLDQLIQSTPDELYEFIKSESEALISRFNEILFEVENHNIHDFKTRKEAAEYIKKQKYSDLLFSRLDNKEIISRIWNKIKPEEKIKF